MLIAFEGIDGSGKSTQSNLLAESLGCEGYLIVHTRPETDDDTQIIATSKVMTQIKAITHNTDFAATLGPETEVFLYLAQIAQLTSEVIEPALAKGKMVISDRYIYSLYTYFHYGKGMPAETLASWLTYASHGRLPDIVVYTDIPAKDAFAGKVRAGKPFGRKEMLGPEFFEKVRQGFLNLAARDPSRWLVVDTKNFSLEMVHQKIKDHVNKSIRKCVCPQ